ncbi:MAG: hypothetical protein MUF21_06815 [Gemmatimonadaceae bacterium]|nr:hypothetical protein [Gemmatimonadaceae bacterium]
MALVTAGWDHTVVSEARVIVPSAVHASGHAGWRAPALTLALTVPWMLATTSGTWKLALGVEGTRLRGDGPWGVQLQGRATLTRASDATGRRYAIGLEMGAAPGTHRARGTLTADLGYRLTLATHVRPGASVRALWAMRPGIVAPDEGPDAGWHRGGASQLRLGIAAARIVGDGTLLVARAGFAHAPNRLGIVLNPMLGQLPFHATLGVGRPW